MRYNRPIAFLPELARTLGGVEEALYYQQLHFWSDKGLREDGFIYKTLKQLELETTLSRRQQDRIREKLVKMGWLEVKKTHAPNGSPTLHYRCLVDIDLEFRGNPFARNVQMDLHETAKSKCTKRTNALYTESTTEKTTSAATSAAEAPFNLSQEIKKMEESKRRDLNIIALYLDERRPDLRTKGQISTAIKRHIRAAASLKDFTDDQLIKGMRKAKQLTPEWTLETIVKMLTK